MQNDGTASLNTLEEVRIETNKNIHNDQFYTHTHTR